MKHQIPSTNNQIMTETPMTQIPKIKLIDALLGHLNIGDWNLFGAWDLVIGISLQWLI
jgi:hypothetical protein